MKAKTFFYAGLGYASLKAGKLLVRAGLARPFTICAQVSTEDRLAATREHTT